MAAARFDPQVFLQRADNVALHVPAAELFGLLRRSFDLPVQWTALVRYETGDFKVVRPGETIDGDDIDDVLFVRVTPVELTLEEDGVVSRDRFQTRVELRFRIRIAPERTELTSFRDAVVASRRAVQTHDLARHLQPVVRSALAALAAEHDADALIEGRASQQVSDAVASALEPPLFSAGMILDGSPAVRFDSDMARAVQETQQRAALKQAEHDAERRVRAALEQAQSDHLDHLASLLSRLKDLAGRSPDVDLPDLVKTFSQRERGELYDALFRSEPSAVRTGWIVVAAGEELLFFDPANVERPAQRFTVRGSAGPIRSVFVVDDERGLPVLLLGAATGVYRWPLGRTEPDLTLTVGGVPDVRGGFNAVAMLGETVWGSHSELGLIEWRLGSPSSPRMLFESMTRAASAVRGVCRLGDAIYCAVDDVVIRRPVDASADKPAHTYRGSLSTITSLCPTSDGVFAGNGDGDVLLWQLDQSTDPQRLHTGMHRPVESVHHVSTAGVKRLIYTDTSLHVHARVLGDNYACRYEAGGQTLRRVEIAPDLLVATNDLRDRLIAWAPDRPDKPSAVIGVSRLTGRSVQDVCLMPRA